MYFQDRCKEIADSSGLNRIDEGWQKIYDKALEQLHEVCELSAQEARQTVLEGHKIHSIALGDFVGALTIIRSITEDEFRLAGLYEAGPKGLDAEKRRAKEWWSFRNKPEHWVMRAGHNRSLRLWDLVNQKLKELPEPVKKE